MSIKIAIVSDLHCHEVKDQKDQRESFLIVGDPQIPIARHPVQSLVKLNDPGRITADVLLCPGDLTNRVSKEGIQNAWFHLLELQRAFRAKLFLSTLGNHDVDSRGPNPFNLARTFHPDFPRKTQSQQASFWTNGFFCQTFRKTTEFLVLNTVIDHHDFASAERGTFDAGRIAELKRFFDVRRKLEKPGNPPRLKIAMMHHHPVLHSNINYGSNDVLPFGDQLMAVLAENGFQIVIHGHRHEPRISRQNVAGKNVIVIAAGSFSAYLKEMSSTTRNLFHLLEIRSSVGDGEIEGGLKSWEFNQGSGWNRATSRSAMFPHQIGFSSAKPTFNNSKLISLLKATPYQSIKDDNIYREFPELAIMMPDELEDLQSKLLKQRIKLVFDGEGFPVSVGRVS
jgi:3',5'-cyclic AMP phosphodiesterase CpdA